ncbi:hypothetical protein SALWKB12_0065 [Snodgrassella communis]|nr:hypothetical protein SALWKB12_0065 [Snodgrassella communis]
MGNESGKIDETEKRRCQMEGLAGAAWDILALFGGYSLSTEQGWHVD